MKTFFKKKKQYIKKQGITVLVASLVASILLAIGLSIFNTTVKDLFFASTAKESEIAFYAADTAAECAQYWDYHGGGAFATSTQTVSTPIGGNTFVCSAQDITTSNWSAPVHTGVTIFRLNFPGNPIACADVTVTKTPSGDSVNSLTTISTFGYDGSCTSINSRTVQRGVQFSY
ncbi:MAG: hypothetical protein PHV42_01175 [Candidatus Pacebacteria bacterium]|nr:hypothetical protein [Candidatus Paceibacterota bacterium]